MAAPRATVTFASSVLPDPDVDAYPPPGREIAEHLQQAMQRAGLPIHEPVEQHESYGWFFTVRVDGVAIWCMLQRSDDWMLICEPQLPMFRKPKPEDVDAAHRKVIGALDAALRADLFSQVEWAHATG
jgi:hypothetical protein